VSTLATPATVDPRRGRLIAVSIVVDLVYATAVASQYVAWRLGYQRNLGPAMTMVDVAAASQWHAAATLAFVFAGVAWGWRASRRAIPLLVLGAATMCVVTVGPLYAPQRILVWLFAYRHVAAVAGILRAGVEVGGGAAVAAVLATMCALTYRPAWVPTGSHGTAVWGDGAELAGTRGLLLGRGVRARGAGSLMRYDGEGHIVTIAPTRSGKGVGAVLPNLLSYPGSMLVTDLKGENHAVTAAWRAAPDGLGQAVHALDPFGMVGGRARYNPLDLLDGSDPDAFDTAAMLADMIITSEGPGESVFWAEEARAWLAGVMLHVVTAEPAVNRTLTRVRQLLRLEREPFAALLDEMRRSTACSGIIAGAAARLGQKEPAERSGVLSSAQSHTHFLDSLRMAEAMSESTFTWESMKTSPATVYLVIPPDLVRTYRRWTRLMIACALRGLIRERGPRRHRVVFLLDEFAQLGRIAPVEDAVSLVGGYGVTIWSLVQNVGQLRKAYPEGWSTFLANADVLQTFGVNDWETAEWLSKMAGDETIRVRSESRTSGTSSGRTSGHQQSASESASERGRKLILPDEVRKLASDEQLLFVRGRPPYRARRLDYRAELELTARAAENPMYVAAGVGAP